MRTTICINNAFDNIKHDHLCCYLLYWCDSCAPFFIVAFLRTLDININHFSFCETYIVGMYAFKAAREGWLAFLGLLFTQSTRNAMHANGNGWCVLSSLFYPSRFVCIIAFTVSRRVALQFLWRSESRDEYDLHFQNASIKNRHEVENSTHNNQHRECVWMGKV